MTRIRIQEDQKHVDPVDQDPDTDPDPQHCPVSKSFFSIVVTGRRRLLLGLGPGASQSRHPRLQPGPAQPQHALRPPAHGRGGRQSHRQAPPVIIIIFSKANLFVVTSVPDP
jgi:hypothetical protein